MSSFLVINTVYKRPQPIIPQHCLGHAERGRERREGEQNDISALTEYLNIATLTRGLQRSNEETDCGKRRGREKTKREEKQFYVLFLSWLWRMPVFLAVSWRRGGR